MKYFLFDTETTGLPGSTILPLAKQPYIIEFYGCLAGEDGTVYDEIDTLIKPPISIPQEVVRIHGIDDEAVKDAPDFKAVEPRIRDLIGHAGALVAHNLPFDTTVLGFELRRTKTFNEVEWPSYRICTVEQTLGIRGHRLSLSKLYEYLFDEQFKGAHRAKVDVQALTRCFVELRKRKML